MRHRFLPVTVCLRHYHKPCQTTMRSSCEVDLLYLHCSIHHLIILICSSARISFPFVDSLHGQFIFENLPNSCSRLPYVHLYIELG